MKKTLDEEIIETMLQAAQQVAALKIENEKMKLEIERLNRENERILNRMLNEDD